MSGISTETTIAAVRGAVPVAENTAEAIGAATERLLRRVVELNRLEPHRIVSAIFTATDDLDADYPAHGARRLDGWRDVPLLSAREVSVPGGMPRLVRVLLTVSGVPVGVRLTPVYLDAAAALRPDLSEPRQAPGKTPAVRRVAIVGLGQIGGSIALALGRAGGWHRVGYDHDPAVIRAALDRGALDSIAGSITEAARGADVAVAATPVDTLAEVLGALAAALPPGAALLDTGSTRAPVTSALRAAEAAGIRAVGGHPLAGSEGRGLGAARADLFQNQPFVLLPVGPDVPEVIQALVRDLGSRVLETAPQIHDAALARTSHLPYLVACALREIGGEAAGEGLHGPGFRDMTRLAASDPAIALGYCRANALEVGGAWAELRSALERRISELTDSPE